MSATPGPWRLDDRVALITGGAGHVGRAVAKILSDAGARVVLVDLPGEHLDSAVRAFGADACGLGANLEDESDVRSIVPRVLELREHLDVIVHAAALVSTSGSDGWVSSFETQRFDLWRRALEINLTAPVFLTQTAVPALSARNGSVIFVSSIYGMVGPDMRLYAGTSMGNPAAYAASKGGLLQMTRWLATVLAPRIRVNAVTLGGIARAQNPEFVERYVERTPLGRMGTEADAAGAVLYLASNLSGWVTGQNLIVDGGWTAW